MECLPLLKRVSALGGNLSFSFHREIEFIFAMMKHNKGLFRGIIKPAARHKTIAMTD
jgi:hypothetical protein